MNGLDKYHVVLACAAFIVNRENKILIVKKSPDEKVDGGLWTVPGGKVEPTEHILDALKREAKEESNMDLVDYMWLNEDVFEGGGSYYHGQHFLCRTANEDDVQLESKLLAYEWIAESDLNSHEFHPNIRRELQFIFDFLKSRS